MSLGADAMGLRWTSRVVAHQSRPSSPVHCEVAALAAGSTIAHPSGVLVVAARWRPAGLRSPYPDAAVSTFVACAMSAADVVCVKPAGVVDHGNGAHEALARPDDYRCGGRTLILWHDKRSGRPRAPEVMRWNRFRGTFVNQSAKGRWPDPRSFRTRSSSSFSSSSMRNSSRRPLVRRLTSASSSKFDPRAPAAVPIEVASQAISI